MDRGLRTVPDCWRAYWDRLLGVAYSQEGLHAQGRQALERAAALQPQHRLATPGDSGASERRARSVGVLVREGRVAAGPALGEDQEEG